MAADEEEPRRPAPPPDFPNYPPPFTPIGQFISRVFIRLDVPAEGIQGLAEGKLWADNTAPGSNASGPIGFRQEPSAPRYRRAHFPAPGLAKLHFKHPRYILPLGAAAPAYERDVLMTIGLLVKIDLRIRASTFLLLPGEKVEFHASPASIEPGVVWSSSNTEVLQRDGAPNQFRARREGIAEISIVYGPQRVSRTIAVRGDATQTVLRPVDPADVVFDREFGGLIVRGEVVVVFRHEVPEDQRSRLFQQYKLIPSGIDPALDLYETAFDPAETSLRDLLASLRSDPRVGSAAPSALVEYLGREGSRATIGVHKPSAVERVESHHDHTLRYWSLYKTEALAAFGMLNANALPPRRPQAVVFIDSGLYVSPAKTFDDHFNDAQGKTRVDLKRSKSFDVLRLSAPQGPEDLLSPVEEGKRHGNAVAGVAAAIWENPLAATNAVGVDPTLKVGMLKVSSAIKNYQKWLAKATQITAAMEYAAKLADADGTRVLNISMGAMFRDNTEAEGLGLAEKETGTFYAAVMAKLLRDTDMLVVLAAGNIGRSYRATSIANLKDYFKRDPKTFKDWAALNKKVILVGGTMILQRKPFDPQDSETYWDDNNGKTASGYDPAGGTSTVDLSAPGVDIAAPGHLIWVTSGDGRDNAAGTSEAAPFVSATAALLFSILPPKTPAAHVKELLLKTGDPIVYLPSGVPPKVFPKLYAPQIRGIGSVRLNVWQALLAALNQVSAPSVRHVGLRISADVPDLKATLDGAAPPPDGSVPKNLDHMTKALRVTLANTGGAAFPKKLVAHRAGQADPVYELTLRLTTKSIDALAPRFVRTILMYTLGGVVLRQKGGPFPENLALFTVSNSGFKPPERDQFDFLEPQQRRVGDTSIKPWMQLSNGDSYVFEKPNVVSGPSHLQLRLLSSSLDPLPQTPVDDEGNPYVTIPFGPAPRGFVLDAQFPQGSQEEAVVSVKVFSLNNERVRDELRLIVRPPGAPPRPVVTAPGWFGGPGLKGVPPLKFNNPTSRRAQIDKFMESVSPKTWRATARVKGTYREPFGRGEIAVLMRSPSEAAPGGRARFTLELDLQTLPLLPAALPVFEQAYEVEAKLALPSATAASGVAPYVEPLGNNAVVARFVVRITNRSEFPIRIAGIAPASTDTLFPGAIPPAPLQRERITTPQPWPPLTPGQQLTLDVEVLYHANALNGPPGREGRRTLRFVIVDPDDPQAAQTPKYNSDPITLHSVMKVPPEGR